MKRNRLLEFQFSLLAMLFGAGAACIFLWIWFVVMGWESPF